MYVLYSFLLSLVALFLKVLARFQPKMKLFVEGRKSTFSLLEEKLPNKPIIWFHAASLGEYEQGLPVMEAIKNKFPDYGIVLTFFSPSGYEVRKNNTIADVTVYLPLDLPHLVERFLHKTQPKAAIFIKYEYWPNYLKALKNRNIPTYLVSGIFRKNQIFFKPYGGFYRKCLSAFHHFFVQNESSEQLIKSLGFNQVTCSGDTRFDRVMAILESNTPQEFVKTFKRDNYLMVIGSSWPKDEQALLSFINDAPQNLKFIIAPHNIKAEQIQTLQNSIQRKTVLYTEMGGKNLQDFEVMIVDTVGLLTKIYRYADWAYVGGGFGNPGVHNVLEPAVFGIPVIIGPNYSHFAEATDLVNLKGCISIQNSEELNTLMAKIVADADFRAETGRINREFISQKSGATNTIMNYLQQSLFSNSSG
jgi:3-deoxy-D-manno-octulosonic-acid transferase